MTGLEVSIGAELDAKLGDATDSVKNLTKHVSKLVSADSRAERVIKTATVVIPTTYTPNTPILLDGVGKASQGYRYALRLLTASVNPFNTETNDGVIALLLFEGNSSAIQTQLAQGAGLAALPMQDLIWYAQLSNTSTLPYEAYAKGFSNTQVQLQPNTGAYAVLVASAAPTTAAYLFNARLEWEQTPDRVHQLSVN